MTTTIPGTTAARNPECENAFRAHQANPFFVLELPPSATREEIERQSAKLLAMLAAGLPGSETYSTPWGACPRTPEGVRAALAELRDPERRLHHEWWARGLTRADENL